MCASARVRVYTTFVIGLTFFILLRPAFEQEAYTRGPERGWVINKHLLQQTNCRQYVKEEKENWIRGNGTIARPPHAPRRQGINII